MSGRSLSRSLALALVVALGLTLLSGCGRKGPVKPKLTSLPAAPGDLQLQQQGNAFLLSWALPEVNQDGSPAEDLRSFEIMRLVYAADDGCPTCRTPEQVVASVDLAYPEPAQRLGKRLYWRDPEVVAGSGYRYAVVPRTLGRQSGEAALIHRGWQTPPATPAGFTASAGESQVSLSWSPVAPAAGRELVGYNLYRRTVGTLFVPVPVNPQPLEATGLVDRGLESGRDYEYRVSSLVRVGGDLIESELSAGVVVTPAKSR